MCHFMVNEDIVLGHKISELSIEVDKAKVDAIEKIPFSKYIKCIRSFLGHVGFICVPLNITQRFLGR